MTFERSHDWERVKQIATHPKVWPHIGDDFAPEPEQWEPNKDENAWYVFAKDGDEVLGLIIFWPENAICWRAHICMLPESYGEKSHAVGRGIVHWIWQNTPCRRIVANVPEYNRLALAFAVSSGLEFFGRNEKAHLKDGRLHALLQLGVSKPA